MPADRRRLNADEMADFGIEIGDDLVQAAVDAVDRRRRRRRGNEPAQTPATAPPSSTPSGIQADADVERLFEPTEDDVTEDPTPVAAPPEHVYEDPDLDEDADTPAQVAPAVEELPKAPPPTAPPTADPASASEAHALRLQLTEAQTEARALREQLEQMDHQRIVARKAAQAEGQERLKAQVQVKRMGDELVRAKEELERALNERLRLDAQLRKMEEADDRQKREMDIYRDRRRKEAQEQALHGHAKAMLEMLPVLDHLELAMEHARANPDRVVEGVQMVLGQFRQALQRLGVERIDTSAGAQFLPELHEAIVHVARTDIPPGTVSETHTSGYTLNGRLLRAARVSVAATEQAADAPPASTKAPEAPPDQGVEVDIDAALAAQGPPSPTAEE